MKRRQATLTKIKSLRHSHAQCVKTAHPLIQWYDASTACVKGAFGTFTALVLIATCFACMCIPARASTPLPDDLQLVPTNSLPAHASWYSVQRWGHYPPSPANWCAGRDDVLYYRSATFGTNRIIIDDSTVDYSQRIETPTVNSGDGLLGPRYNSNDFYLEITLDPNQAGYVDITAHGLISNYFCQILSTTNDLAGNPIWAPGPYFDNSIGTNQFTFSPILSRDPPQTFFRGVQLEANPFAEVIVFNGEDAIEPSPDGYFPGLDTYFLVQTSAPIPSNTTLTIYYTLSGTAINGVDYTNLSGSVVITNEWVEIWIEPTNDFKLDFDETVVITLVPTNGYVVYPGGGQATVIIHDDPFVPVAKVDGPTAVDFSQPTQSLLVSANLTYNTYNATPTNNFFRLDTNGAFTVWSGISNLYDEVKIATVRSTTNAFTQGEMFFSTDQPGVIGRVSPDGNTWTTNWVTLVGETNHIRGGLTLDTTGIWGYDLIAVTGEGQQTPGSRSVWRIHSSTNYSRVAVVTDEGQLEGVTCIPNDDKYGPWAGKILTGDEYTKAIYSIDTNGTVTFLDTLAILPNEGIGLSDVDVVLAHQDLYCTLQEPNTKDQGLIIKIPSAFLTNYLGEIVVTQSGEITPTVPTGRLFFLHWDAAQTNFVARKLLPPPTAINLFEHSAFAPIHLPPLTP